MLLILNILYSASSLKIVVVIGNKRVICLIDTDAKICLIKEEKTLKLNLNYIFN